MTAPAELVEARAGMAATLAAMDARFDATIAMLTRRDEPIRIVGRDQAGDGANAPASPKGRTCPECGLSVPRLDARSRFCRPECKAAFNNRRAMRGAALYDLFMTLRYERSLARKLKVWRAMCRLAAEWRRLDHDLRGGRTSWGSAREAISLKPYLTAERGPSLRFGR